MNTAGLRLAWHNHDFEYRPLPDGTRPIDHLFDAAGPNVGYEVDFAWVTRGGGDPLSRDPPIRLRGCSRSRSRTPSLPAPQAEGGWAATGDGIVDWQSLWPLFANTPADHLVVEHDEPLDWRRVAARSLAFIRKLQANAQNVE